MAPRVGAAPLAAADPAQVSRPRSGRSRRAFWLAGSLAAVAGILVLAVAAGRSGPTPSPSPAPSADGLADGPGQDEAAKPTALAEHCEFDRPELIPEPRAIPGADAPPAAFVSLPFVVGVEPRAESPLAPARFKRRKPAPSPDELVRQLLTVKEIKLEKTPGGPAARELVAHARQHQDKVIHPTPPVLTQHTELAGLPLRMGADCHLGKESAEALQFLSRKLRTYLSEATRAGPRGAGTAAGVDDPRTDVQVLKRRLQQDSAGIWQAPEAIPTLVQMLQAEDRPLRQLLVDMLANVKGREASRALAQRAVFDISAEVREQAVSALRERPADEYRDVLIESLRYPWAPAAEFAAEALVNLNDTAAVPVLEKMLDDRNPAVPFATTLGNREVSAVRELVRVNHLKNCMLCHEPSLEPTDLVRGQVPDPRQPLPPSLSTQYYNNGSLGPFVRADVTYLKQDFAVPQPVAGRGPWPAYQRFDYLVRTRRISSDAEVVRETRMSDGRNAQRESILFAWRELKGGD